MPALLNSRSTGPWANASPASAGHRAGVCDVDGVRGRSPARAADLPGDGLGAGAVEIGDVDGGASRGEQRGQ